MDEYRATVPMSFDNPALRPLAEADESTSRAVRELLRLKAQVTEVTPTQHGDTDCHMVVVGRGVWSEEARRVIPIVDEAISSIVGLEQRRLELVGACQQEEAAIAGLQCRLDAEEQRRLVVLPAAVQREHDASLRDMAELKWLVAFNQRQCSRLCKRLEDVGREDSGLLSDNKRYQRMVPAMEQKEAEERQSIEQIKTQQKQVLSDLREAEEVHKDREGLHQQTLRWAEEERSRLAATHSNLQQSRDQCRARSAAQLKELSRVDSSVAAAQQAIAAAEGEGHQLDDESKVVAQQLAVWEGIVSSLSKQKLSLQQDMEAAQQASADLTEALDSKVSKREGEVAAVRAKLRSLGKTFRELRGANEELRQIGDELREGITQRQRQRRDAERGVVRACAEVKSLDEQMQVSSEAYSTASASHSSLSEQLKACQNRVMETELTWKATVEALATQQREECKTRAVYESRMTMEERDMQEAEADHRQKVSKIMKVLETAVEKAEVQEEKTKMAEKEHTRWTDIVSAKETQLQNIQEWVGQLEAGLEEAKRDILPQLRTHKRQAALIERQVRAMREELPKMESSVEDLEKCSGVLIHQTEDLNAQAAVMTTNLESLESSTASERSAVVELRAQLQRVQEFGQKTSQEYQEFLSFSAEQLRAAQDQLCSLLALNRQLAASYHRQQKACLKQKALTVVAMSASAAGKATCQDYYQLLCVQGLSAAASRECQRAWLQWVASSHNTHKSCHQSSARRIAAAHKRLVGSVSASQAYLRDELAGNPLLYAMAT